MRLTGHDVMRALCAGFAAAWLVLGAGQSAFAANDLRPLPQSVACLTSAMQDQAQPPVPADSTPAADVLVRALLTFSAADVKPVLRVLSSNGSGPQLLAVRDHVLSYRLPCLKPGTRFIAVQDFRFAASGTTKLLPGRFVAVATEADLPDECREEFNRSWQWLWVIDAPPQSKSVVRLSFTSPTSGPDASLLYNTGPPIWTDFVLRTMAKIRLPCVAELGGSYVGLQVFAASPLELLGTSGRPGLTLVQLVGLMKHRPTDSVKFDLNTMGCPFEVEFEVLQPHLDNFVKEEGDPNPQREAFLTWLRGVTLNVSEDDLRRVLAVPNKISVPCAVLDLT